MGDGINDFLTNNPGLTKQIAGQIASIGLEQGGSAAGLRLAGRVAGEVAGKIGGAVVDPAIWIITGEEPDAVDAGLYATALLGGMAAIAAAGTGVMKAVIDDEINRQLAQAAACEPEKYRKFIKAAVGYGFSGQGINATAIAAAGGTAWLHPNGLWVYLVDATARLVCDYMPNVAAKIYQPLLPLRPVGGSVRWHQLQGGGSFDLSKYKMLDDARTFFNGHKEAIGVLIVYGEKPMFIRSGIDGGPWGGTQRGGIPRMPGWGFTQGGSSQGNIATHVEGHASAIMWQRKFTVAELLVDRKMCNVCEANLANTLPPGSKLRVEAIGEGVTIVTASHAK